MASGVINQPRCHESARNIPWNLLFLLRNQHFPQVSIVNLRIAPSFWHHSGTTLYLWPRWMWNIQISLKFLVVMYLYIHSYIHIYIYIHTYIYICTLLPWSVCNLQSSITSLHCWIYLVVSQETHLGSTTTTAISDDGRRVTKKCHRTHRESALGQN